MFWFNSEWVLYLKSKQLTFFDPVKKRVLNLDFSLGIVSNLEVVDDKKLTLVLGDFLKNNQIKPSNALIILSNETIFSKEIPDLTEESINNFLNEVPFEKENIIWKTLSLNKTKNIILATNKSYLQSMLEQLTSLGFKISGVFPQTILDAMSSESLMSVSYDKKILSRIRSLTRESKYLNFC